MAIRPVEKFEKSHHALDKSGNSPHDEGSNVIHGFRVWFGVRLHWKSFVHRRLQDGKQAFPDHPTVSGTRVMVSLPKMSMTLTATV